MAFPLKTRNCYQCFEMWRTGLCENVTVRFAVGDESKKNDSFIGSVSCLSRDHETLATLAKRYRHVWYANN